MTEAQEGARSTRSAGIVAIAVIASRLFGLVREQVFAAMFGAGKLLDAYNASFQIPNLFRDLFAEGALSTAFTTVFSRTADQEGDESAWRLASLVLSVMLVFLGLLCAVCMIGAPWIVQATNFGFHNVPGKFELTVQLTQILFPFILFVSLAAVIMGMLNAKFVFGVPASASTVFNIVSITAGVAGAYLFDPGASADWRHPHFGERALYGVCLGVLLGGLAQLAMQIPALYGLGFRYRWRFNLNDAHLKLVWSLMWPSLIAGAAVQVNVLVNGMFASEINGGRSWLNCAFRLMQFPIGVFGVSLATVTLPAVARKFARDDLGAFGRTVRKSLRLVWFFTLPSAVGLAVMAGPIIGAIYQHGHFTANDTAQTAAALQAYSVGLAAYAGIKVLVPCFYALGMPKLPLRVSLMGIALNLGLNLFNARVMHFGHVGLALTTSCVALINFAQLFFALGRKVDLGKPARWAAFVLPTGAAAALSAGAAIGVSLFLPDYLPTGLHSWRTLLILPAAIGAAVLVYFGAALAFRVPETRDAWSLVARKLSRRKRAA